MQALLKKQGILTPLSGKKTDYAEMEVLEKKVFSTILFCLADEIIVKV